MTIEKLVVDGYFAEELIPPLTSKDLGPLLPAILPLLDSYDPITGNNKVYSRCSNFSIPKAGGYRRAISIPNPLHQIRISDTILSNWAVLQTLTDRSQISGSKLVSGGSRALGKPSFDDFINQRITRSVGCRYLLKIDISRFYNSIYTHSIPWAIHTKAIAKGLRRRSQLYGNALDEDCRKMMDGQTVGIPVGPDTSRVISEVILSAIDEKLRAQLPDFSGIRIIDDYYLYFKNLGDVEVAKELTHKIMAEFELELNPSKDIIHQIPEVIEAQWYADLKLFRFSDFPSAQRKQLISYFDMVIGHAKNYPDDSVISYAISKVRNLVIHRNNFEILQSLMLNCLHLEPKTISILSEIFHFYSRVRYPLINEKIKYALQEFISFHLDLGNEFEVFWAMWTMKLLRLKVDKNVAQKITQSTNSVIILIYLHMRNSRLISKRINISAWDSLLTKDNLYSEHWLVAYEAKVRGWLSSADNYIDDDPFFKLLADNQVRFYDTTGRPSRVSVTLGRPSLMERNDAYDLVFSRSLKQT